jgi:hypothetical protein
MNAVKEWQEAQEYTIDGRPLVIDGKMGDDSIAKWKQLNGIITPLSSMDAVLDQGSIYDITKNYKGRDNTKIIANVNGNEYLIYDPGLPEE